MPYEAFVNVTNVRYSCVTRLQFLTIHTYLVGVWFGIDQRTKHHKNTYLKNIRLYLKLLSTSPCSIANRVGRLYVFN